MSKIRFNEFDINLADKKGKTILHYAIEKNYFEIANYLIKLDQIDVTRKTKDGYTPIIIACDRNPCTFDLNIVKSLISLNQIDINLPKDKYGNNIFHLACKYNLINLLNYLLTIDQLDPKTKNDNNDNALHIACQNNHIEIIKILLSLHIYNINDKNNQGKSLFDFIKAFDKQSLAELEEYLHDENNNNNNEEEMIPEIEINNF